MAGLHMQKTLDPFLVFGSPIRSGTSVGDDPEEMVPPRRFDRPTRDSGNHCSIQLN